MGGDIVGRGWGHGGDWDIFMCTDMGMVMDMDMDMGVDVAVDREIWHGGSQTQVVTWGNMAMDGDMGNVAIDGEKWPRGQVHGWACPCHVVPHDQGQHIPTTPTILSPSCYRLFSLLLCM